MTFSELFLICFGAGSLWAFASLLIGGLHTGGWHIGGWHAGGHHLGHAASGQHQHGPAWLSTLLSPSALAIFLAWFGGAGYLLNKYSGLLLCMNIGLALLIGLGGAVILARFLSMLIRSERVLDSADYDMVGVLGRVSSTIRADGVGEVIYLRDGARRSIGARSESGLSIARGEEVVVTHFEKGIASVRTWEAMTQRAGQTSPEKLAE